MRISNECVNSRNFSICTIVITLALLIGFAGVTVYVDPLFHFHKPIDKFQYPLYDERYMNDGIVRHFEYDCVITGTSLTENLKPSIFDEYYGTTSVKVPFAGASYKEVNSIVEQAFCHNEDISFVVRGLDGNKLICDKDEMNYDDYPSYLYDNNPFNDVQYVLNKDIYVSYTEYVFTFMRLGGNSTDFDTYKNWAGQFEYSSEKMMSEHIRRPLSDEIKELTDEDCQLVKDNLYQNVLKVAEEHPNTEFFYFVPPYSICYFDDMYRNGELHQYIDAWELAFNEMLKYDNIRLYSYDMMPEIVENLNNYKDSVHYSQEISDHMLASMPYDLGRITKDNVKEHFEAVQEYYLSFDYDGLFENCEVEE